MRLSLTAMVLTALDVPVMRLLDLPAEPACQCCGTPFSVSHLERGADADGTENPAYCKWCYDQGAFAYETMDDAIGGSAPHLVEATCMGLDEAVSFIGRSCPPSTTGGQGATIGRRAVVRAAYSAPCET